MTNKIKCPRCGEDRIAEITKHLGQNKYEIFCNSCGKVSVTDVGTEGHIASETKAQSS